MKKYLLAVFICVLIYFVYDYLVYYSGEIYLPHRGEVEHFTETKDGKLWVEGEKGFEVFDIKGVNLGLGKPGKFATEYSLTKEEYLRWFGQIQDMGANTIRIYTLAHEAFYEAFYEYNENREDPLYLIHGVWVDDYMLNSRRNAFDEQFYEDFLNSCKDVVDAIHGRHKSFKTSELGPQSYRTDISQWVYGYIIGVEWESDIVAFTDNTGNIAEQFIGQYLHTENASNFEVFLAMIGDEMIGYETEKYGSQRTLAFSNWPATDPFEYPENVALQFKKFAKIDVDNIKRSEKYKSGMYASYHIYPYYPEYMYFVDNKTKNTYLEYLKKLSEHHSLPVVISEFGIPSSRGMASYEENKELGRNQGFMSEKEQGDAIVSLCKDIESAGCAGGIVFIWQDEWFKRTWNTMPFVDLGSIVYWSDYQTNEQAFGLLSFDPGEKESICYVDGDRSDWIDDKAVVENMDYSLFIKYDEKFIYFLAEGKGVDLEKERLYIPIDLTPKSGSRYAKSQNLKMSEPADFLIELRGVDDSRILVQERYNTTKAMYGNQLVHSYNQYENPPEKDSPQFERIEMILHELDYYSEEEQIPFWDFDFGKEGENYYLLQTYETGKLTYGNANPRSKKFNSKADFSFGEGFVEIKIPWQLLNFSDPSQMKVHDDYYDNYGVDYISIDKLNIGLGNEEKLIAMEPFELEGLGRKPKYHERLKESYFILKEHWKGE